MASAVRGVIFGISVFISSFMGVVVKGGWTLPMFFISPKAYRDFFDLCIGSWQHLTMGLLEYLMGMKVVITGDEIQPKERNLIIMNHRTRLDWMYFWSVLLRQSGVKTEKIILKSMLKKIPGAGWAMQVGAFIFINRKWEEDKDILTKMINYFTDLKHKTQILLFPEGTDLSPKMKARSNEFAQKNGLKPYEYCLHPRVTGFTYITQLMRGNDHLDAIYDVSVGYPYNFPQKEADLILGNCPKEVHFHIKRYPIQSIPSNEEGLQEWCRDRWEEKEEQLKNFYAAKHFTDSNGKPCKENEYPAAEWTLKFALFYWTVFILGIITLLVYSSLARWLTLFQILFFVYMTARGGFEFFQVDHFNKYFNSNKRD